eukprot:4883366-Amphidinium_carterae.1
MSHFVSHAPPYGLSLLEPLHAACFGDSAALSAQLHVSFVRNPLGREGGSLSRSIDYYSQLQMKESVHAAY